MNKENSGETDPFRVLLSVVDSTSEAESPRWRLTDDIAKRTEAVLEYAEKNGLGFAFLKYMKTAGLGINLENTRKLELEEQKIKAIRKTLLMLNEVSSESDIDYVVIKIPHSILHVPRDIDIFVPSKQRREMMSSLENQGMKLEHSSDVETSLKGEGYAKVDIYSKICYFNFDFLDDGFFSGSTGSQLLFDVKCPALQAEADLTLELLHDLFGHRNMTLLDFLNIKSLVEHEGIIEKSRMIAERSGWGRVFDLALDRYSAVRRSIYDDGASVSFPYLFDRGFILDCVSSIDGLALSGAQKTFISATLLADEIILKSKNSGLYDNLRANGAARRIANSLAHSIRVVRGDRKVS